MLVMRPDPSIQADPQFLHQKYDVTKEEYSLDTYPTYCGGPCTLISGSTMEKSYQGVGSKTFGSKSHNRYMYMSYTICNRELKTVSKLQVIQIRKRFQSRTSFLLVLSE